MTLVEPSNSDKTMFTPFCALKQIVNTLYTGTEGFQCISDRPIHRDGLSWHRHLRVKYYHYSSNIMLSVTTLTLRRGHPGVSVGGGIPGSREGVSPVSK